MAIMVFLVKFLFHKIYLSIYFWVIFILNGFNLCYFKDILFFYLYIFRIFFGMLFLFGFTIALVMLTKIKSRSDLLTGNEFYMDANNDRRLAFQSQMSRSYRASQGASALMQSLNNMSSSTNNRPMNRTSSQQLLNFWTRQIPRGAWSLLPSTRKVFI